MIEDKTCIPETIFFKKLFDSTIRLLMKNKLLEDNLKKQYSLGFWVFKWTVLFEILKKPFFIPIFKKFSFKTHMNFSNPVVKFKFKEPNLR